MQIGSCYENDLFSEHKIIVAPNVQGTLESIEDANPFTVADVVATYRDPKGDLKEIKMSHLWPVRQPRPVMEKLPGNNPLLTGQRVLDALFPTV